MSHRPLFLFKRNRYFVSASVGSYVGGQYQASCPCAIVRPRFLFLPAKVKFCAVGWVDRYSFLTDECPTYNPERYFLDNASSWVEVSREDFIRYMETPARTLDRKGAAPWLYIPSVETEMKRRQASREQYDFATRHRLGAPKGPLP